MDALVDALDKVIINTEKLAVICATAAAGQATILKYYAKTDDNIMIRIGMGTSAVSYLLLALILL